MGKKSCTDHLHSEGVPQETFLYPLRLAHHFPTQVGSESMCKKRWFRPPLLTFLPYSAVNLAGCWANLLSTGGGLTPRTVPLGGRRGL
jgi:hypothetical protein